MPKRNRPILFVSHVAERNGAPFILLGIIKEFKKQSDLPFRILLLRDGPLAADFKALGTTLVWEKNPLKRGNMVQRFFATLKKILILFKLRGTSLVLLNTIVNGAVQKKLLSLKCPFICYVHELEASIHDGTNAQTLAVVLNHTDYFLAGSQAVKSNLVTNHGLAPEKIRVIYSSISRVSRDKADHAGFIRDFRLQNQLSKDSVIVGVAAGNEWRKGFHFFLPLATLYSRLYPESDVCFVWKGFRKNNKSAFYDLYDFKKFNPGNKVLLLPHDSDGINQIASFDIHLLISREDPYPLVVLEAASFGIPTVSFSDAGGSSEFIGDDSGLLVPYGDLLQMAEAVHRLATDEALRRQLGRAAYEKVQRRHDQPAAAREVIAIIESLLAGIQPLAPETSQSPVPTA